jgi:hypothetical protein
VVVVVVGLKAVGKAALMVDQAVAQILTVQEQPTV